MRSRRERPSIWARAWTLFKILFMLLLCFVATAVVFTFRHIASEIPNEQTIENYSPSQPTRILSYDNQVLAVISAAENREFVPISEIPQNLKNATVAIEDSNFYTHSGMSVRGTLRAILDDVTRHSFSQGGSTITQQLARNLENASGQSYTGHQKSLARKINEAILAMQLERHYSKDEILELYLNQVFYGSQAYGVQAAAQTYFGKKVQDLDLAECALIAGLPQRPSDYDPYKDPDNPDSRAIRRRNIVLARMRQLGYITQEQEDDAHSELPGRDFQFHRMQTQFRQWKAPYFVDYVLRQLVKRYGDDMVHRGGLTVYTTLNYKMQVAAEAALAAQMQEARSEGLNAHQMALVSVEQKTGAIKAMCGGVGSYQRNQFNRATHGRQPGSSFKLFDYTLALQDGMGPDDGMNDEPKAYPAGRGKWWTPKNYDGKYRGWVSLRDALAWSENTVAVKLADKLGIHRIIALAEKMGVHSDPFCVNRPLRPYLPTAIGASEVAPVEMAVAYATSANKGLLVAPRSILHVKDHNGATVFDAGQPNGQRVVSEAVSSEMNDMLHSVVTMGTGTRANIFPYVCGKTGTTQDDRDAWFIGFTPELTTAVWAGNDNNVPMNAVHGGTLCAGGWTRFMQVAVPLVQQYHRGDVPEAPFGQEATAVTQAKQPEAKPATVRVRICTQSGLLATDTCPHVIEKVFPLGSAPTQKCPLDHSTEMTQLWICPVSGKLATDACPNPVLKSFPADKAPVTNCDVHKAPE